MYYPNLRYKAGEVLALSHAPKHWHEKICPIWNIEDAKGFPSALQKLSELWSGSQVIDLSRFELSSVKDETQVSIVLLGHYLAVDPLDHAHIANGVKASFKETPIFRVDYSEKGDAFDEDLYDKLIKPILEYIEIPNLLLILDFGEATEELAYSASDIATIIQKYRAAGIDNIVVASGAFPTTLESIVGDEILPRIDKHFFDNLQSELDFEISYSDYGTLSPLWDSGETRRSGHIAIKYTLDDHWLVLRQKGKNTAAIIELAELLVMHKDFRGEDFSWADDNWKNKTLVPPQAGPGNSTGHVAEFMHHHFAQVLHNG